MRRDKETLWDPRAYHYRPEAIIADLKLAD